MSIIEATHKTTYKEQECYDIGFVKGYQKAKSEAKHATWLGVPNNTSWKCSNYGHCEGNYIIEEKSNLPLLPQLWCKNGKIRLTEKQINRVNRRCIMYIENIVVGKPLCSEFEMFALNDIDFIVNEQSKTYYTQERFLPQILKDIGVVKTISEVRRNKSELVVTLNQIDFREIKWGKRRLWLLIGE